MNINTFFLIGALATAFASPQVLAETVVIVSAGAPTLTKEQVADAYIGKNLNAVPLDLADPAPARTDFYKKLVGRDNAQIKAIWARLVFTGKAIAPRELADYAAVKKAVVADPKSIGYIDRSAVDGTVKVLFSVD